MSEVRTPPKRLLDLNPEWVKNSVGEVYGIAYDCPCAAEDCKMLGRASFPTKANFIGERMMEWSVKHGWDITGTSFADVTIAPSIWYKGHWHGFIRSGMVESC